MTQSQTPNTQDQAKPNNLAALDKKVADGKAAEQQPAVQAPSEKQMQADGKPGTDAPAAPKGDTSPAKN